MNPFGRRLWASAWYLLAYLGLGTLGFSVAFTAATTAATVGWTLVGLPLLIGAAAAIRGCANVERARTGRFLGEPLTTRYREVTQPGIWAQVKTRWKDPALWRDIAYLVGMFVPLLALDTIVFSVWLYLLGGITLPIWYRFPWQTLGHGQTFHGVQLGYFPNGPHVNPRYGFYIDSLPRALIAAAVCLILFLLFSRVLVLTARVHANVARALLRCPPDPLAEVKEVLSHPGPLSSLRPNERVLYAPPARVQLAGGDQTTPHTDYPREATMRQSQSSVLPETNDKRKRPAGVMRAPVVERIAGWSARHKKTAVFGWFALVAIVFVAGQAVGTKSLQSYDPGQSGQAERALNQLTANNFPPSGEEVLIQPRTPNASSAAAAARETVAALTALHGAATGVQQPAWHGHSALITFTISGDQNAQSGKLARDQAAVAAVQARHPDLTVAETGDASIGKAVSDAVGSDFRKAETTTLPITLVLLVLVFGAFVAAGIPVLLAGSAVMAAISLLAIPSRWLPIGQNASEVVLLIGMAVGVDYTLFYLRREREERAKGATFEQALRIAAGTSGRSIVVSGLTVMVAMAGLFLTGIDEFSGIAFGTIMVVGIAVAGSLTVLPALLSWLGPWADRGRIPFLGRGRAQARPSRVWTVLVRRVVRHPVAWGGVAAVAVLALATPALGLRLGAPHVDAPASLPVVKTMGDIQRTFGQRTSPAEVVVTGTGVTDPRMTAAIAALRERATAGGAIRPPVVSNKVGAGLLIDVPLAGGGQDTASFQALSTLRGTVLPQTIGRVPGVSYAVTGDTAEVYDWTHQLHDRTPLVFAVVAAVAFVLLMAAFRSVGIALVSIGLNLLSVGAAYGIITLIFQDGRLQGALDYTAFGGIIFWVPLFMFVFLFGISMDYHVFILSRIRELRRRGTPARAAVVEGISSSAGVVTSAAVIMVAVFSIFATLSLVDLKILGLGTAAAVLIDATVVRGVLLPAALALLGDRAWQVNPLRRPRVGQPPVGQPQVGQPPADLPRQASYAPAPRA